MMDEFLEEFLECMDIKSTHQKILQKASAWYVVTYSDPNAKFLSFPWTVSKYLINIKIQRTLVKESPFPPAIINLDERIIECESKYLLPRYDEKIKKEKGVWSEYNFACSPQIIERAFRTLLFWGEDADIVETPGKDTKGLMFLSVFTKLFLHVAESLGTSSGNIPQLKIPANTIQLVSCV
jgi:hypothetical protein